MGIIFPAPAWAVRATKESDKINMGWGYIKYTSVGVPEWCSLPNTASIKVAESHDKNPARTSGFGPQDARTSGFGPQDEGGRRDGGIR